MQESAPCSRAGRPAQGKERIALRVGKVLNRFKVAKHFRIETGEESFRYCRNHESITAESCLDGISVVRTSMPAETMAAADTVRAYKGLSRAERAFRSLKSHVLLCMLAYYVECRMRVALAQMLFEVRDPAGAVALRDSVVAPAKQFMSALRKIHIRKTCAGLPVHSFRSLMADLGTLMKNRVQVKNTGATFDLYATATSVQNRAFDLLGISPRL